jgi:hypothetical protein
LKNELKIELTLLKKSINNFESRVNKLGNSYTLSFIRLCHIKTSLTSKITGKIKKNRPFSKILERGELAVFSASNIYIVLKNWLLLSVRDLQKNSSLHMDRTGGQWPYTRSSKRAGYISKINMENRKGKSQCKKQVPNRFIE